MLPYYSTTKVCGSIASIVALVFTDMTNVSNYGPGSLPPAPGNPPDFTDVDLVYSIAFERFTGEVTKDSATDQGGDFEQHRATVYVPRSRSEIEILLQRMRNRFILVIGIDRYGNQHILYNARRSFRHTTGAKPGTRHGYEISWTAASDYLLPAIAGNGDIETAPPEPGEEEPGEGGDECCITIQPVKIAYTPTPTGNVNNNNELVTTANDTVYFIDNTGRSIILNRPAPRVYRATMVEGFTGDFVTMPAWFPLPDPDDYPSPTYDVVEEINRRMKVKLGGRWINYADLEGWTIDYAAGKVYFETSLDGATLEFWGYTGMPPIVQI